MNIMDEVEVARRSFVAFQTGQSRQYHRMLPVGDIQGGHMVQDMLKHVSALQEFTTKADADKEYSEREVAEAKEHLVAIAAISMTAWTLLFDH